MCWSGRWKSCWFLEKGDFEGGLLIFQHFAVDLAEERESKGPDGCKFRHNI